MAIYFQILTLTQFETLNTFIIARSQLIKWEKCCRLAVQNSLYVSHAFINVWLAIVCLNRIGLSVYRYTDRCAATSRSLIIQMALVMILYTYTSIALFQLITYPDRTNVSMCSMWIFPRSVPTYSHLLWSGRWMQVILLKADYIWFNWHSLSRSSKFGSSARTKAPVYLSNVSASHISRVYDKTKFKAWNCKESDAVRRALTTNLSLWNLRLCTTCGIFWRKFHKCNVPSPVADTSAPSLIKNCKWSTDEHPSCLTWTSTPGLPKLFPHHRIHSEKYKSISITGRRYSHSHATSNSHEFIIRIYS